MDYKINFIEKGMYYVFIREFANDSGNNSLHVGLNKKTSSSDRIEYPANGNWIWTNNTLDNEPATINIKSAEIHTFNVYMREDGVIFDKILLTKNSTYVPTNFGPPESEQEIIFLTGIDETEHIIKNIPNGLKISSFPNPFNPNTTISYFLPESGNVILEIFDINGEKIKTLVNGFQNNGNYEITWDASNTFKRKVGSGNYFARIS